MHKQRRIILVTSTFPQLSETFLVSKFANLVELGWDVHMVCTASSQQQRVYFPALANPALNRRVHVAWMHRPRWLALILLPFAILACFLLNPIGAFRYIRLATKKIGLADALRRMYLDAAIISLSPNLVHFEFGSLAVEQADIGELLGCKVVVSFRGYDIHFAGLNQPDYYSMVWKHADALHLLSVHLWEKAMTRGCPSDKPHVFIAPALEINKFIPEQKNTELVLGTHDHPIHILSVGRLEWKKGYEYAFQALHLLSEDNIHFEYHVIGAGEYFEALSFARYQLGLEANIHFMGGLPQTKVIEQLCWADVFLHPSLSEGFCNAVLEAQAMQVPVVCSDAGGLPENVLDAETGFVVPRRDPAALAEKLKLFARDPGLRKAFGIAGRKRVEKEFQLTSQLKQLDDFYRSLLIK